MADDQEIHQKRTAINPEEFKKQLSEYHKRFDTLQQQAVELKSEREAFIDGYANEAFNRSGYAAGQKITDEKGRIWYITGAHVHQGSGHVYLSFNFAKKDGSMSKVKAIGRGEPDIKIK